MGIVEERSKPQSRRLANKRPTFIGQARPKVVIPKKNVFEAAIERLHWLFDEFDNKVTVSTSGGKDSTVVVELAAMVAKERGCLPLNTWWVDQECEFQSTVDYQRYMMYERDDIEMRWYQIPFKLENSTNLQNPWLNVWGPGEEWVRPKEPGSIHENTYGQDKWYDLLAAISAQDWDGACITGMRVEESPARRLTMTSSPMYKWATWSVVDGDPGRPASDTSSHRFRFHPIYDWSYRDVWKFIFENNLRYNKHYDHLFQRGIPTRNMRVSNFHHESAIGSLHWLQEVEPETWEAATRRLEGINTYGHLKGDQYPNELPYMFSSWTEYMDYLIQNLIPEEGRADFYRQRKKLDQCCADAGEDALAQIIVKSVIGGDYYGTHVNNFAVSHRAKTRMKEKL